MMSSKQNKTLCCLELLEVREEEVEEDTQLNSFSCVIFFGFFLI